MENLSITQKYLLCILNERGRLPSFNETVSSTVFASALFDLILGGQIKIENQIIIPSDSKSEVLEHLKPLLEYIYSFKSISLSSFADKYTVPSTQNFQSLFTSIGDSLAAQGYTQKSMGGLSGNQAHYIPDKKTVNMIIEGIKTNFETQSTDFDESIIIVTLLEKSGCLKKCFSVKGESDIKKQLRELKSQSSNKHAKEIIDTINNIIITLTFSSVY